MDDCRIERERLKAKGACDIEWTSVVEAGAEYEWLCLVCGFSRPGIEGERDLRHCSARMLLIEAL